MDGIPSSVVAAIACSAAAGKNPWIPLGILICLAAPETVPSFIMQPELQQGLHSLADPSTLYAVGGLFLVLATLEALADKIGFVEKWLVPISTVWRPFAGVAVAALIAMGTAASPIAEEVANIATEASMLGSVSIGVLIVLAGGAAGYIATVSKTGIRLLLMMVPLPGLRLAHSFLDDFFAIGACIAGVALGDTVLVAGLAALYLLVGVFTGPILARLAWIHLRIGWALLLKWNGSSRDREAAAPTWLRKALAVRDVAMADVTFLPAYVFRSPEVGLCRVGFLVYAPGRVFFATRVRFRARLVDIDESKLARVGLAQTATNRLISLVEHTASGLRELSIYLFPADEAEVLAPLDRGAADAGLVRVRVDSASARTGLAGYAQAGQTARYLAPERAGSLRAQALTTLVCALAFGVLSGGIFIPIGAGYALSPFYRRFALGLLASVYLTLAIFGSLGFGWPAAVLYGVVLNAVALRDLTRQALKARVDGFIDLRAYLPAVCDRAWVPRAAAAEGDLLEDGDPVVLTDGGWRAVVRMLAT